MCCVCRPILIASMDKLGEIYLVGLFLIYHEPSLIINYYWTIYTVALFK